MIQKVQSREWPNIVRTDITHGPRDDIVAEIARYLDWGYQPRVNRYSADGPIECRQSYRNGHPRAHVVFWLAGSDDLDDAQAITCERAHA